MWLALLAAASLGHSVYLGDGPSRAAFTLHRPAGVILLFRLSVPHGARVAVSGRVPGVAGVGISTRNPGCRRRGARDVCTQPMEWCSIDAAAWRFRLVKRAGPAGRVELQFVVGQPT
jgi:hypothetical protein